ncbi:aspartic peptidase domain-containing protein [Truncatella angustata]|uniref:Aspartic peptidase domain-containing protein n=1 Tax=Truncatella angustata TaxID=152316 RepID=A0A9P8UNG4_9PEZI|nr:aspartic peptidase domain-containing protein [Truncatella angustata]KAH6655318.1 aspartic peptidase domain-containing protein [Truncatella angustata]
MAKSTFQSLVFVATLRLGLAAPIFDDLEPRRNYIAEAGLSITDNFHPLIRVPLNREALLHPPFPIAHDDTENRQAGTGTDHIKAIPLQTEYLMQVGIGGSNWSMIPDTGSSDTWLMSSAYQCLDRSHAPQSQLYCNFGPSYGGEFSGGKISDQHMNITYGGGDSLNGDFGYADVTVAGITVPRQQMSLVTSASIRGNGLFSGILGLGLRGLTTAYLGTDPSKDNDANAARYPPLVETMSLNGTVSPVFSIAMSRDDDRSFISFGGVPPAVKTGEFATTPISKISISGKPAEYLYYGLRPESVTFNNTETASNWTKPTLMIVDTGTTLAYFPRDVADNISSLFSPPAEYYGSGTYVVQCDAIPPTVEIGIGGKKLRIDPSSLILPETRTPEFDADYCTTGIARGSGTYILGDVFLQELLVVFDVSDKKEMKFAQRTDKVG